MDDFVTDDHQDMRKTDILSFIQDCADTLSPSIRDAASADAYADKLLARAIIIHERDRNGFSGMVAFYCGTAERREAFITMVAVRPDARNRGLGNRLVLRALSQAKERGCTTIALAVQLDNDLAQGLYEKLGFSTTYEKDGQAFMSRDL